MHSKIQIKKNRHCLFSRFQTKILINYRFLDPPFLLISSEPMQDKASQKALASSDFEFQSKLGKGSFGVVYRVKRKSDKKIFVLKQINISNMKPKLKSAALNEAKILGALESPYIVKYYDSFLEKNNLNIVMEFCEGGDISKYIKSHLGKTIEEDKIWRFLIQMLMGLNYIHHKKILHRDIKAMNIFLTRD